MIPADQLIVVRALWGDDKMAESWQKVIWDMRHRAPQYSALLNGAIHQRWIAFGPENARILAEPCDAQPEVILVDDVLPQEYAMAAIDPMVNTKPDRWRRRVGGRSTWWHKLQAIRLAMLTEPKPAGAIWIDWDCACRKAPDKSLVEMLRSGPSIQGCNVFYCKGPGQCPWREGDRARHAHLNGGCYYFGRFDLLCHAISVHAESFRDQADEPAVTYIADRYCGPRSHNPLFYTARDQEPPGTDSGYFRQGRHIRIEQFLKRRAAGAIP